MIFTPFAFMAPQVTLDPDAAAYISAVTTAGGSLSGTQETAIDTFFTSLKSDGVYDKLHAMYPFVGGVANAHKINATNPGTYDLTFNGTWTHSNSNGSVTTDDNANYADTAFNPSSFNSTSDFSMGYMVSGSSSSNGYSGIGNGVSVYILIGKVGDSLDTWSGGAFPARPTFSTGQGFFHINNRTTSNNVNRHYALGGTAGTLTTDSKVGTVSSYSANLWINNINGAATNGMSGDYRFFFMAESLSNTEAQDLTDAVNTLNVAFSRNIFV